MADYYMPRPAQHRSQESSMYRPTKAEDWEPYRDIIAQLYTTMKLKDVMLEMQMIHHFKATEKQYKTQLKKWNLDTKYIKASEYMAMIKTKRQRESENPPKQTRFTLRGRTVDPKDITRFEKRALKKGMIKPEDQLYGQGE
ncbi:Clr5 domain-containing protein [Lasiosphaeris hirsuta]|uniref:Clr5 domain-containing protein n=1 Tax=Lasiosphaeris hirsuta TaxID=260670 RepID=A0AA40DTU5_9PEZI|nr:Clr5 domain-containing protein [Lasiosphaeris hirsuta]